MPPSACQCSCLSRLRMHGDSPLAMSLLRPHHKALCCMTCKQLPAWGVLHCVCEVKGVSSLAAQVTDFAGACWAELG